VEITTQQHNIVNILLVETSGKNQVTKMAYDEKTGQPRKTSGSRMHRRPEKLGTAA